MWSLSSTRHPGSTGLVRASVSHARHNIADYSGVQLAEVLSSLAEMMTSDGAYGDTGLDDVAAGYPRGRSGSGSSFPAAVDDLLCHLFQRLEEHPGEFRSLKLSLAHHYDACCLHISRLVLFVT